MAHKPTKPTKPTVTAVRVRTVIAAACVATMLTAVATWGVLDGGWPTVVLDLVRDLTLFAWTAALLLLLARHVMLYVHQTSKAKHRHLDEVADLVRSASVIDEAQRYVESR